MTEIEGWKALAEDWEDCCNECHSRELALYNDLVGIAYDVAEYQARVAELEAEKTMSDEIKQAIETIWTFLSENDDGNNASRAYYNNAGNAIYLIEQKLEIDAARIAELETGLAEVNARIANGLAALEQLEALPIVQLLKAVST